MPGSVVQDVVDVPRDAARPWHVLWTHSHCERLVHDQLAARGFELFLPKMNVWSRSRGERHRVEVPMFPGYVFLRHSIDRASYLDLCTVRGLVRVLGTRWDQLEAVPDTEVEAIQRVGAAGCPVRPHPYLRIGQRVRITRGPLSDVEGIFLRSKHNRGILVLSVDLLQRAVAVEIDCTSVAAA